MVENGRESVATQIFLYALLAERGSLLSKMVTLDGLTEQKNEFVEVE